MPHHGSTVQAEDLRSYCSYPACDAFREAKLCRGDIDFQFFRAPLLLHTQFATIELRRREIDKHRQAQKKREHSQEEAEKDAIRKTVEGEKAWAETER